MSPPLKSDEKKVVDALAAVMKVLNKKKLSISELILFYGNLGYHIGTSIMGYHNEPGPNIEELKREYYSRPTADTGLALQGLLISSWEEDYLKNPALSNLVKVKEKKE